MKSTKTCTQIHCTQSKKKLGGELGWHSACLKHTVSNQVQNTLLQHCFPVFLYVQVKQVTITVWWLSVRFCLTNQLQLRLDLQAGFDWTLGFNPNWKNHDPDCKFPQKCSRGRFNTIPQHLRRLNLLSQNLTQAPEISQIEPSLQENLWNTGAGFHTLHVAWTTVSRHYKELKALTTTWEITQVCLRSSSIKLKMEGAVLPLHWLTDASTKTDRQETHLTASFPEQSW